MCPGAHLAESVIFIYAVTALATLDMSRFIEDGVESVPRREFREGLLRCVCGVALADI